MHTTRVLAFLAIAAPAAASAQWKFVASGTSAELRGISIVDYRVVWASGARGTVLRSTDGGKTWKADTIQGATHLDFRSIHAIAADTAFVASAGEAEKGLAAIYATYDGGRSWERVYFTDTKGVFIDAIAFWNPNIGVALSDPVDGAFFLLMTTDAGHTWKRLPPERMPRVLPGEAAFAASGSSLELALPTTIHIGTGGGGRARVMTSEDMGETWRVVDTPIHAAGNAAGIFALDFVGPNRGIAVGGDYTQPHLAAASVALTFDGGATWRAAASPPAAYLSGVAFDTVGPTVAVGIAGTFYSRDGGDTWRQTDSTAMNAIRGRMRSIAVGPRGRVARTEDPAIRVIR